MGFPVRERAQARNLLTLSLLKRSRERVLSNLFFLSSSSSFMTPSEDILQESLRIYLQHGGNLFTRHQRPDSTLCNLLLFGGAGTANLVSRSLFHVSDAWTVDELSSFGVCFLGTVAHGDPEFRTLLKERLGSYRSPLLAAGTIYADSLYESTFGIASVLGHFHRMDSYRSRMLLCGLCKSSTPSMLRPFLDTGLDLDDDYFDCSMLGYAASVGNLDVVRMLIERGANGAPALDHFIGYGKDLSDGLFKHLLELLVECSRPTSFLGTYNNALLAIIRCPRALLTHPEAPEILIRRKVFSDELIKPSCRQEHGWNYMCLAIRKGLGAVVELLLQNGAYASTMSAWLIFSIECGTATCTEALIRHGADVNFLDGAGRSALQVARSNMNAPHPRIFLDFRKHKHFVECEVTAEEDADILTVVERAFELTAQSTKSLDVCAPSCELESQSLNQEGKAMPVARNMFQKALRFLSTYYTPALHGHRVEPHHRGFKDLWSLSFYEALLMRFFYVLSYALLLAVGILAVIQGDKRVRMPSRSILSAVALLFLAIIWGSSLQTNLPLKLDNGWSFTTQDS